MNNVLHVHPIADKVNDYINSNLNNISAIKMSSHTLLAELERLEIIERNQSVNSLIICRKITNELFNNACTKERAPISSSVFCSELGGTYLSNRVSGSFLIACYYYSIPIFINDVSVANNIFGAQFISEHPLISDSRDYYLYDKILSTNVNHYAYLGVYDEITQPEMNMAYLASMGPSYPDYTLLNYGDYIEEDEEGIPYLYDKIT